MWLPKELEQIYEIADAIISGKRSDLVCPWCGAPGMVYSYAVRGQFRYSLYIECNNCKSYHHFSLTERPQNFNGEFIQEKYQLMDDKVSSQVQQELKRLESEGS